MHDSQNLCPIWLWVYIQNSYGFKKNLENSHELQGYVGNTCNFTCITLDIKATRHCLGSVWFWVWNLNSIALFCLSLSHDQSNNPKIKKKRVFFFSPKKTLSAAINFIVVALIFSIQVVVVSRNWLCFRLSFSNRLLVAVAGDNRRINFRSSLADDLGK